MTSKRIQISIYPTKEELALIDKASKIERRNRSSFCIKSALDKCKEIIKKNKN